jgi:hypothetical protein
MTSGLERRDKPGVSFPGPVTAGPFEDRDLHGGQQHAPPPDSSPGGS